MKRLFFLCAALLCALFAAAFPALAEGAAPDLTLTATFDGALALSPKEAIFSAETGIVPGDSFPSNLLFQNHTDRTVEFALQDVLNLLSDDANSLAMLGGLDVEIVIGGETVFSGTCGDALGRSSGWFSVGAGGELPMRIDLSVRAEDGNDDQGLSYQVCFRFQARVTDASPAPAAPRGPKTGVDAAVGNTFDALFYADLALIGIAAVLLTLVYRKKRSRP